MTDIDFMGPTFVDFRDHRFPESSDHGFRWVDVKSFRFPRGTADEDVLAAFIGHEQFRLRLRGRRRCAGGQAPRVLLAARNGAERV